jgi:transposase
MKSLKKLEWSIEKTARQDDYHTLYLLRSIPGVGQIPALVILYEIQDVKRFQSVQNFSSYARRVKPVKESDGKWAGHTNKKIGNHHLKWAIKESAILMLRDSEQAKQYVASLERKYNKGKASAFSRISLDALFTSCSKTRRYSIWNDFLRTKLGAGKRLLVA